MLQLLVKTTSQKVNAKVVRMDFQLGAAAGRGFIIGQMSMATPTHVGVVVQWAWFFIMLTWLLQR
ncbi:MAG: hypothetical protein MUO63_07305 [Desulfobulbaceae bacterium]|nr:hypothetical protein [Desulfobulbaceae bacterium]